MKTLKYILLSCVVLGAVACDDFLVETPDTSVEKSGVYNSLSSAKAALAGCYGNMAGYNGYAFNYFHVLSVTSGMGVSIKANDVYYEQKHKTEATFHLVLCFLFGNRIFLTLNKTKQLATRILSQSSNGFLFNLAYALTSEAEFIADFFQRHFLT